MSWTDDIRCLHCDGKLPLYRKITHGQFCSTAHRKAYWQDQERLVVERLEQTHNALHAYRPAGAVEAILGRPESQREEVPPDPAGLVREELPTKPGKYPEMVVADPIAYEMGPRPFTLFEPEPEGLREPISAERVPVFTDAHFASALAFAVIPSAAALESFEAPGVVRPDFPDFKIVPTETEELREALEVEIPGLAILAALSLPNARLNLVANSVEAEPILTVLSARIPQAFQAEHAGRAEAQLSSAPLAGLAIGSIPLVQGTWIDELAPIAVETSLKPTAVLALEAPTPTLPFARGQRYAVAVSEPGAIVAELEQLAFSTVSTVSFPTRRTQDAIDRGLNDLRLPIAAGRRDPVVASYAGPINTDPQQMAFSSAPRMSLPQRPAAPVAPAPGPENTRSVTPRIMVPGPSGLVSMSRGASDAMSAAQAIPVPQAPLLIPQPPRTEPSVPTSKLEPLDAKPIADLLVAPPVEEEAPAPKEEEIKLEAISDEEFKTDAPPAATPLAAIPRPPLRKTYPWTPAADFLKNAPRDLKMLVFAIPVLLGLALHPSLPKVKVTAPASTAGIEHNVEKAVNTQLVTFRQSMLDRAAVALDEDFRSGLDDWVSRNDATAEWSFDATGFVQPGPLALYRPSIGLTDYTFQFLGMIDKKAMSWVVRAADFQNYYVVKLVVLKSGPLPTIGVTRYAVINGKPESRADSIAPVDARADMLYRVRLDVHDDMFVLVVQGQVIDSWSEPRLKHGGVGFFSARGESSRVRWVQVTHQYDMLGRLCAYLAPYNNSSSNGSFQP